MNSSDSEPNDRRKSVLFCPECGHESPIDGDWIVVESDGSRRIRCPGCGTAVAIRPRDRVPVHTATDGRPRCSCD